MKDVCYFRLSLQLGLLGLLSPASLVLSRTSFHLHRESGPRPTQLTTLTHLKAGDPLTYRRPRRSTEGKF